MSTSTSKPKGLKRLPDVVTKDVAEITKEPEIQIGLEHTKTVLLKQTKVIQTLTMSKSSDDPTAVKPGSVIVGTTDVEPLEAGKEFEIEKAASTAEIVMGAPETTSPKISPELSPKEETQTMENPDSQITEATLVEETKVTPKRRKSREDPVSQKPSTRDVVTAPKEITVVEKGKMSPTKRRSNSPKPLSEVSTKDVAKITKEPDIHKSSSKTETPHLQEKILTVTRVGSKSSDDPTAVKPVSVIVETTDVEPCESGKELDIEKATSTAEIVMGAPETTSPKFSPELSPKDETQTKENPDSQITEATIEEETKVTPKRRKSREDPVSHKPSTRDVVTAPTEITVVEKGKMSPTKRRSKSPKPLSEVSPKEVAKITEEPDIQKSLEQTETPHLQETILSATKVLPKTYAEIVIAALETRSRKVSQELSPKEETQTMEKPDSQITEATIVEETKTIPDSRKSKEVCEIEMPSSSTDVVTPPTEITVMEKGEATSTAPVVMGTPETMIVEEVNFSPPTRKLKCPKDSQELSPKEKTQTAVKPDSQITEATIEEETKSRESKEEADIKKPYSTTDVVRGPTDITVVEKGKMLPTTSKPKGPKCLPDVATKDVAEITKEPEIQIGLEHTKTVLLKQTKVIQTPTMSKSSDDTTAVKPGSVIVGTTDVEPEPEKGAVEMTEIKVQETRTQTDIVGQRDSDQPTSAVYELLQPPETEREVRQISRNEEDTLKPCQSEIKIETTQDRSTEVKEHGVKEQQPEMSLHGIDDVATNLEEKSVKIEKIPMEHQVCVLQIDTLAGPLESQGEKEHTHDARQSLLELSDGEEKIYKEPEVCVLQPDTQEPLKEHETQCDVIDNVTRIDKDQGKDSVVERSIVEMKEADDSISVETAKEPRREVDIKGMKGKKLPQCKDKTETDLHSEKAAVKTKAKVQQITTEIQVSAQSDSFTAAQQLEENKEPVEISSSQQDKVKPSLPSNLEHEPKTVTTEKEPSLQFETVQDHKDVTTTEVLSLVKTVRFEVEVSSTESPEFGTIARS